MNQCGSKPQPTLFMQMDRFLGFVEKLTISADNETKKNSLSKFSSKFSFCFCRDIKNEIRVIDRGSCKKKTISRGLIFDYIFFFG